MTQKTTKAKHQIDAHKQIAQNKPMGVSLLGSEQDDGKKFKAVMALMFLGMLALVLRAVDIQMIHADSYWQKAMEFTTGSRIIPVVRGKITDRFGVPLAVNAPLTSIVFSPYDYASVYYQNKKKLQNATTPAEQATAQKRLDRMDLSRLSESTGYDLARLQAEVAIDDSVDPKDAAAVQQALPKGVHARWLVLNSGITQEQARHILALDFVGIGENSDSQRFYLQAEPNAQVLGYMGKSVTDAGYKGRSGIERQYDALLAGKGGKELILKNAKQMLDHLAITTPITPAKDITLTLDSRLQYLLYKNLEQVGRQQSARWASGIVVDVATGDILAMTSWPSFNSNDLRQRHGANERNRVLLDVFEPGSVIKPFTVAAALESGKYNQYSTIATGGSMRIGRSNIHDAKNYGDISLGQLIQKSSNIASSRIALSLPADAIASMQKRFGFGQKTTLNFPAEASGKVATPKESQLARRATLSYGYGQEITLAQLAQAYATLAAGGVRHPLRLVQGENYGEPVQVIDAQNAQTILAMMELVTLPGGTGRAAAIDGYRVAGKTGTARRSGANGYIAGEYRTTFAGIAPVSAPRFVAVILVEDPRQQFSGGAVAAPVFSQVMSEALRLYNVPLDKPLDPTSP